MMDIQKYKNNFINTLIDIQHISNMNYSKNITNNRRRLTEIENFDGNNQYLKGFAVVSIISSNIWQAKCSGVLIDVSKMNNVNDVNGKFVLTTASCLYDKKQKVFRNQLPGPVLTFGMQCEMVDGNAASIQCTVKWIRITTKYAWISDGQWDMKYNYGVFKLDTCRIQSNHLKLKYGQIKALLLLSFLDLQLILLIKNYMNIQ